MTTPVEAQAGRPEHSRLISSEAVYAALAGLAALTSGGIWLLMVVEEELGVVAATVQMVVKFTNLTTLLVGVVAAWIATGRSRSETRTIAHLTVIVMAVVTSAVNMTLLGASLPGGWWGVVDLSQHYLIPIAVVTSWSALGPSVVLRGSRLGLALLVPLAWLVVVLGRGAATDSYPYDFLDVSASGWAGVLPTVGMILVFMLVLAAGVRAVDQRRHRTPDNSRGQLPTTR